MPAFESMLSWNSYLEKQDCENKDCYSDKKEPNPGYLDHFHFAKKGLALAGAMMNVIMKTKSRLSLLAIGCGNFLLQL